MPRTEIATLVSQIAALQIRQPLPHFAVGLFPSYRTNKAWLGYRRPDDNIFGTASTLYILQQIAPQLPADCQQTLNDMLHVGKTAFPLYQNKDGLATYNFWRTKPSGHFPYGYFFRRWKHFKLPDDIDDTALIYAVQEAKQSEISWLKDKLTKHTGSSEVAVYSTWFGQNMPIEQDACALSNLMALLLPSGLPLTAHDNATLDWLLQVIETKSYIENPFEVARHYATTPLIVYHYARWLPLLAENNLYKISVQQVVNQLAIYMQEVKHKVSWMEQIILDSAMIKLTHQPLFEALPLPQSTQLASETRPFYSFIGAFLAPYSRYSVIKKKASWPLARLYWHCEAHALALILENRVLRQNSA